MTALAVVTRNVFPEPLRTSRTRGRSGLRGIAAVMALAVAVLAAAEARPARGQAIVTTFPGISFTDVGSSLTPPDTMGAVGIDDVVMFCNGGYAVYDKAGTRTSFTSDRQFWIDAGLPAATVAVGISDPRITFDPTVSRWFATEITVTSSNNLVLVGRSDTADPKGSWKATSYVGVPGFFADYDALGVDSRNVYVGSNNFDLGTQEFVGVGMTVIPKADILAPTPTVANALFITDTTAAIGAPPRGVTNYSGDPGHGVLMATDAFSWQTTTRVTVNGSGTAATLSPPVSIATAYDAAPGPFNPAQPGGTPIDVVDSRYTGAITQVGNDIYMTNTVLNGDRDAVHWLVVDERTNAIVGEGLIADPAFDFLQPSIGVNPDGTFLLGFNRVGTSATIGDIGIYAAVGTTSDSGISVGSPFLLAAGTVANFIGPTFDSGTVKRWGDYSATVVDPTNPNLFWTFQEIPATATDWTTRVTAVVVPEPSALALAGLGLSAAAWLATRPGGGQGAASRRSSGRSGRSSAASAAASARYDATTSGSSAARSVVSYGSAMRS